jgi:hypothetical protein
MTKFFGGLSCALTLHCGEFLHPWEAKKNKQKKKQKRLESSILSLTSFENKNKLGKFSPHFNCDLVWWAVFGYSSSVWTDF